MSEHNTFSNSEIHPIFICGEGRSGTKLLRDCLALHPELHNFRTESYFFVDSTFQKLRFIDEIEDFETLAKAVFTALISKNRPYAEKIIKSRNFEAEIEDYWQEIKAQLDHNRFDKYYVFDKCTKFLTQRNNKSRWIEKTPFHIYYIEKIKKFYPNAKFIVNYRDPRAVVASWLKKDSNKTLLGIADTWNKVADRINELKNQNEGNIYYMKYEELITQPEKVIKEICDFIGVEFSEELLKVSVVNSFYEEQGNTGFNQEAINRWQKILSKEQIKLIDSLSSDNRALLGYPDFPQKVDLQKLLFTYIKEVLVLPIKKLTKLIKWVKVN